MLFGIRSSVSPVAFARPSRIRWVHSLAAGVDTLPLDSLGQIVLTNSRGLYADALAEWVIAAMLWFAKDLRRLIDNQAAHKWEPFNIERLEGKSVGIIGFGGIGRAIGKRAEAMGMRVIASRRTSADTAAFDADYVILSVPLTRETRNLMHAARIEQMKPASVLINVSRGAVVDEAALVDAPPSQPPALGTRQRSDLAAQRRPRRRLA